jgi:2-keto-4-pentenoate hydratase
VLGWKAGVRPDVGAVAAPLVPFIAGDGGEVRVPWHARLGVEVEIGFRLAHDIHVEPGRTWRRDDLLDHIDHALLGIELTGGRLADAGAAPFTLFVADSMENAGYVAGPPLGLAMLARVAQGAVSLSLRGPVQWDGIARHPQGDPLEPLLDFANARLLHLGGLKAGQIVTTGALCGLLPVSGPGHLDVCIDGAAAMRLTFVA